MEGAVGAGLGRGSRPSCPTTASTSTCRSGPPRPPRGPDDIVKRLKIGIEPLDSYENFDGLLLDNGTDVMYEHHEEWHWPTGESAVNRFVTVHRVENGKITLWKDYWDMATLANSRATDVAGRLRQRRHVLDFRRDRPGLRRHRCST